MRLEKPSIYSLKLKGKNPGTAIILVSVIRHVFSLHFRCDKQKSWPKIYIIQHPETYCFDKLRQSLRFDMAGKRSSGHSGIFTSRSHTYYVKIVRKNSPRKLEIFFQTQIIISLINYSEHFKNSFTLEHHFQL